MKVLHVIPSVAQSYGGPATAIAIIEKALSDAGVIVTTLTTDDDGPGRRLGAADRPPVAAGAARVYARKWLEFYKVAPSLAVWLWRNVRSFDVVHVHALFSFSSMAAALVARLRGVPYILRPLGTLANYGMTQRRPWLKRLSLALIEGPALRHAAAVHFTSQAEWDEAASLGIPIRGAMIPLAVPTSAATPSRDWLSEHPRLQQGKCVLFLSRVDPKKNIEGLLRGFAQALPHSPDTMLAIAGSGNADYLAGVQELSRQLGLEANVVWLGHIAGARKAAAFEHADIFILPSFNENFGIAAAEALLAGLPCILGHGVAIAGQMSEAGAGITIDPEPGAIAAALTSLLCDDARRVAMGERARDFSRKEFAPELMVERLLALYRNISAARQDPLPSALPQSQSPPRDGETPPSRTDARLQAE